MSVNRSNKNDEIYIILIKIYLNIYLYPTTSKYLKMNKFCFMKHAYF